MLPSPSRRWSARQALGVAAVLVLAGCTSPPAADPAALLSQAEQALGAGSVKTLRFSGRGTGATFGQAWQPAQAWPALNYSVLTRVLDYDSAAMREDYGRSRAEANGGGAVPLMGQGEQRVSGFAMGDFAWNAAGSGAVASPVSLDGRVHDLWTTPHGAVKAARRHGATVGTASDGGQTFRTFSYNVPGRLSATAWLDAAGLITRVDSRMPHPVLGDTEVTTHYSEYRAFGDVRFPMRIRQSQGGHPVLDLAVQEVQPNAPAAFAVPDNVRQFSERAAAEKVAEGVWFIGGGSHNSVAIEMSNHVVLVEAPLYDGRTAAVLAEVRRVLPGKPVRTVINSHHHFDHAGGLRTAVADGASLVTSQQAKPYFERVFANPNRIRPDRLAQSGRQPEVIGVVARRDFVDGDRRIEVHEIQGSVHAQGFLMVYLPKERLLIEADAYTPGAPNTPPPAVPNANTVNLAQNIERLGLQVDRVLPLHGRVVPIAEMYGAIGRTR
jgi:glyoxylase-like metal-dependent hydrolase (beta-lactamase superfamily II)